MKRAIVSLGVVVLMLLGATGLMVFLYLGVREDTGAHQRRVDELTKMIDENKRELSDYQGENATVTGRVSTLESSNNGYLSCAETAKEMIAAARGTDDERLKVAIRQMEAKC